jgi:hypothetical protein
MKNKNISIFSVVCSMFAVLLLTSCAGGSTGNRNPSSGNNISGSFLINYADYKSPVQYHSVDNRVQAKSLKTGIACTTNALFLVALGDSSIETAMKNGDITKIAFVDTSYSDLYFYYPFYQKGCTIVKGE